MTNCEEMFEFIYSKNLSNLESALAKCNPNLVSEDGESLLIYAVMMENNDAVDLLLKHGANTYTTNFLGDNALHLAVKKGFFNIVKIIANYQGDLNVKGQDGFTALNYAAFLNEWSIAKYLAHDVKVSKDIPDDVFNLTPRQRALVSGFDL
ncbi:ankyrin repeat domain-containing protein [Diaphorobacter sp. HDW4A]|uniref:ankyrin repeat domain-containing protein n=1 Tax=Diaphorobacter sp. HDW4A TaxID=2714924 RepID=UPI00140C4934|nr:ankyrin repeat domain-containing protein [Diaphorobacter sp. HDW4A]QIL80193.1 ankyrin repeat domain-containing protein [Diaphorobacter sp. HDW4A]